VLEVGRVVRPHGLGGQVVVELWTNREERMAPGSSLSAAGRLLVVSAAARLPAGGGRTRWRVAFYGTSTREQAEALRGEVLSAEPLEVEGALWVHEMVGADLYDATGRLVGRVDAVEANPASDLLVLGDGRVVPLTFVSRRPGGGLVVEGPEGLLEP
jgi:16S rRNA processing protein RimM